MDQPFFSVVIPTLNEEEYLPKLLHDIVSQKDKPFEVIVVDGGSIDKTIEKANKFSQKIPLTIITSTVKNVSTQRNLGAKKAKGKYLIFFDADVRITPLFFQKLKIQIMKTYPQFATTYVNADSKNFYDQIIATFVNMGADLSIFVEKPFAGGWNMVIEKNTFENIGGFREDLKHAEDWDLAIRLYQFGIKMKVFRQPRVIYSLRRFRQEGRLVAIRKHAKSALHVFTKGPITEHIFSYPMGGGWYKNNQDNQKKRNFSQKAKKFMEKFRKWIEE